jgi:hypothetical protein
VVKEECQDLFDEHDAKKKLTGHRKEVRRARRATTRANEDNVLKRSGVSSSAIAKTLGMSKAKKKAMQEKML